jgi:hypothetical protein
MNLFGNKIQSLLSSDRIANLIKYSNYCAGLPGYLCELGIYHGGSLEIMAMYNPGKDIVAIDSFQGLPAPTEGIDYHSEGQFNLVDFPGISGYFKVVFPTVRIFKGFIPKVFEVFDEQTRFAFSHCDLDMYESVKNACDFVFPRTLSGGMILFDDYMCASTPGATKAINEFFVDKEVEYKGELKYFEGGKSHYQYLVVAK